MGMYSRQYLFSVEGFGNVIHSADGKRFYFVMHVVQGADEDDGDVGGALIGFEFLADFVAVHFWHHDVEKNEVGWGGLGRSQGRFAISGRAHDVVGIGQDFCQKAQVGWGIINYENAVLLGCHCIVLF